MQPPTIARYQQMITDAMHAGDWQEVDRLAGELDRAQRAARRPVNILSAALWYASVGLHVFPLQAGQKIPHKGTRGCKDATDDEAQIRAWWQHWPDSNVAIATGHIVDVIDIDGPVGVKSWAELLADPDGMPPSLGTVNTPRAGGTHLYRAATGRGNKAGIFPSIDYRGTGGYVVAPPSVNSDRAPYTWRRPLDLQAAGQAAA